MINPIYGFSKLNKNEKINAIVKNYFPLEKAKWAESELQKFWHQDSNIQKKIEEFSENTLSNFVIPFGVAPNLLLNNKLFCVPMAIEESSVVAASSKALNFWLSRGGFYSEIISTLKEGQIHFLWNGNAINLENFFQLVVGELIEEAKIITSSMEKRGGGIVSLKLCNETSQLNNYYQIKVQFETCDAMGANFINSVLELMAKSFKNKVQNAYQLESESRDIQIIMSILSNYTPECLVRTYVTCPVSDLYEPSMEMSANEFAEKFELAIKISKINISRAVTHNKGIFNGIDAVVVATGNDYRAIEATGHAYACRDGVYRGLSDLKIVNGIFTFELTLPLALGTVGGLTSLHPLSQLSLHMLSNPTAKDLMSIVSAIGLAQNFAAVRSLVTSGIQKGHMKMHLMNILNQLNANEEEIIKSKANFENEIISFNSVKNFIASIRE